VEELTGDVAKEALEKYIKFYVWLRECFITRGVMYPWDEKGL